jgi:hypothetical protein
MIKSIYIMQENGVLLYSKNFMKEKFESNLLVGFFASIANFSREALNSVVKNMDLGEDNKLILQPMSKEKLLGAAIVGSTDNNDLITEILNNIVLDFVNETLDEESVENIDSDKIDKIVKSNLKRKKLPSQNKLIVLTLITLIPLLLGILAIYIYLTNLFEDFLIGFPPALMIYSVIGLLLLTILPNLISGLLAPIRKIELFNSLLIITIELVVLSFSLNNQLLILMAIANLPINLIMSLAFAYMGQRISSRRFLT